MKNHTRVVIGLTNPKSPTNVGAVMRAAGCFKSDKVYYTGKRYAQAAKFSTDTKNISARIPLKPVEAFDEVLSDDEKLVCIDLVEGATALPEFMHPDKAFYVFGPEDGTISQSIIDKADHVVYVPTIGCLNLAATVNIVLYDRFAKAEMDIDGDELIKESRDTNNKVKVKIR